MARKMKLELKHIAIPKKPFVTFCIPCIAIAYLYNEALSSFRGRKASQALNLFTLFHPTRFSMNAHTQGTDGHPLSVHVHSR